MEMFANNRIGHDNPARLRAYSNFKGNLEDMFRIAHKADVPVILSTVAVNLKDCAPLASIHAAGLDKSQESAWNKIYEEGVELEFRGNLSGGGRGLSERRARLIRNLRICSIAWAGATWL